MGESACLLQPLSYTSGFSNESIEIPVLIVCGTEKTDSCITQGNPIHALGQSISFGRFMSESLDWEKWSTFSNKRYVEEAEKISRPGSVAQKKAFFEAHYKKIAAQKAAALLELEQANSANAAKPDLAEVANSQIILSNSIDFHEQEQPVEYFGVEADVKMDKNMEEDETIAERQDFSTNQSPEMVELSRQPIRFNDFNQTPSMEKPLLKNFIHEDPATSGKKKTGNSSSKYLHFTKASKIPSSPARQTTPSWHNFATPKQNRKNPVIDSADKRRSTQKSLGFPASFTPIRELHKLTSTVMRKIERSKAGASFTKASKDCSTPLRTPIMPLKGEIRKHPASTPWSEKGSSKFLSTCTNKAKSHFPSTPFSFRTEERAARRKEKLEEKFIANDLQNSQQHTKLKEKAELEIKKLRQTLCFKARPLPDFYKERKEQQNEIKKVPLTHLESPKLGRKQNHSRREGAEPTPRPSVKTSTDKSSFQSKTHSLRSIMATHENTSPNIQQ